MSSKLNPSLPPCYAMVHPGLEQVAADEIETRLDGEIRKTVRGIVVFRPQVINKSLLTLRTTEDVFLLAWASGDLTRRATDLDLIARWTSKEPDWKKLIPLQQKIRPKKHAKTTYRLVVQAEGERAYFRRDAREAFAKGLGRHLDPQWLHAEENADIEFWLTIDGTTAVSGIRLSDKSMRHRLAKWLHRPASLRPSVAAAMIHLAKIKPGLALLDPCCGSGTLEAEYLIQLKDIDPKAPPRVFAGDILFSAVEEAKSNLRSYGDPILSQWDAGALPLADQSIPRIVANPPFGKQLGDPEKIPWLYKVWAKEWFRVTSPGGRCVAVTSQHLDLNEAFGLAGWKSEKKVPFTLLGQRATISVWIKPF